MALVPIGMVLVFVVFYAFSQSIFIECPPAKPKPVANTNTAVPNPESTPAKIDCEKPENKNLCTGSVGCEGVEPTLVFAALIDPFEKNRDWTKGPKQENIKSKEIVAKRYSGRFIWMFLISANVLFGAAAFGVFLMVVVRWWGVGCAALLGILAVGLSYFPAFKDAAPIARPLFESTIMPGVAGMAGILDVNQAVNWVAYSASIAMIFAIWAVLFKEVTDKRDAKSRKAGKEEQPASSTPKEKHLTRKETLLKQMFDLKLILYVSTVLLIVGLLRLSSGFTWALAFMTDDTAKIAEGLLANVTTVLGGFFTMLLACTYLPAVYILWRRAEGEDMAEMEKKGFKFSFNESLPKILAIAAPLLTGPIAEVLKNLVPK